MNNKEEYTKKLENTVDKLQKKLEWAMEELAIRRTPHDNVLLDAEDVLCVINRYSGCIITREVQVRMADEIKRMKYEKQAARYPTPDARFIYDA